jgi:hypothetical protein
MSEDQSPALKGISGQELSDLPQPSRDRIQAAALDAERILRANQDEASRLMDQARELGVDPSGVGYSPGSLLMDLARTESQNGRERSSGYLFSAVAIEYWKLLTPDVDALRRKLDSISGPIATKFGLAPSLLNDCVEFFHALALRERANLMASAPSGQTQASIGLRKETAKTLWTHANDPRFEKMETTQRYNRSPLLGPETEARLNRQDVQIGEQLARHLEIAAMRLRSYQEELGGGTGDRVGNEMKLGREIKDLHQEIVGLARTLAVNAVKEFAAGLLLSRNKLQIQAPLLRGYCASMVRDIRQLLNRSHVFQIEPLLAWPQDPIAQEAIRCCEDIIAERTQEAGGEVSEWVLEQNGNRLRTWPAVVQRWESRKSTGERSAEVHERIPEADFRSIIAEKSGTKPEDVSEAQIEDAALELCRHYGSFQIIPTGSGEAESNSHRSPFGDITRDVGFWREREDEFRKHDSGYNSILAASWSPLGGTWRFQPSGGAHPSFSESVRLFKSLAREAAKGLGSSRGTESWIDWLDLLRCAKDERSGEIAYAQITSQTFVIGERERERMIRDGEHIPAGALIEFAIGANGLERRLYCETSSAQIERLFRSSANLCLELRSLARQSVSNVGAAPRPGGMIPLSNFWKDRQSEFANYVDRFGDLSAHWRAAFGKWILSRGSAPSFGAISGDGQDVFKAIAMKTTTKLFHVPAGGDVEPWQVWLSVMRARKWQFRITHNHPVSERVWEAGVKFGRPLVEVRRELGLATGDEETEVLRWLEDGSIDHVFQASADFCEVLAAEAFEKEAEVHSGVPTVKAVERLFGKKSQRNDGIKAWGPENLAETEMDRSDKRAPSSHRRGPLKDYETARSVASVVARLAADAKWRSKLDDICLELDENTILFPKTWKARGYGGWFDCLSSERHLVEKAISHHLKRAKEHGQTFS